MLAALGAACLAALPGFPGGGADDGPETAEARGLGTSKPNIVMIMTDDQPLSTVKPEYMPRLHELIIDPGTTFSDYIVTTPLCCPSRATTITGQYGHNNGVLRNNYADLNGKKNILPEWLRREGYKTAHIGKFMNGYEQYSDKPQDVAPGWDLWFTQLHKRRYYNWKVSKNGKKIRYGEEDKDHATDVSTKRAKRWAAKLSRKDQPFYLQLDYFAPHGAAGRDGDCPAAPVPSPQDEGAFALEPIPMPPSFNEADVTDKPSFIQDRDLMSPEEIEKVQTRWRCTVETMLGVDRGIGQVYDKIASAGEIDDTIFIFASDNGYYFGEHRIPKGKPYAYEENVHMPLSILVPEAYRDFEPVQPTLDTPVANLDLAPTILDLAGADPCRKKKQCRTLDGHSLMPLLNGDGGFPGDRSFLVELSDCSYRGVRSDYQVYFEHGTSATPSPTTGQCEPRDIEHYDLDLDPWQLENLYPAERRTDEARFQRQADRAIAELHDCSGIEGRDPEPESGNFCG